MFRRKLMARREVLKGAMGSLLLAPLLRQRELQAQNLQPKRLVMVFTPDSHPPEWWPDGGGTNFSLRAPLAAFRGLESEMLFVRRLDHSWTYNNHHIAGIVQLFTGGRFNNNTERYADGPSLDQYLLEHTDLRGGTPRANVALTVDDGRTDHRHVISYSGSGQPIIAEVDPHRAYANIFGGVNFGAPGSNAEPSGVGGEVDRRITELGIDELRYMQQFLGQTERERLELHVESLSELRTRIDALSQRPEGMMEVAPSSCQDPDVSSFQRSLTNEGRVTRWAEINAELVLSSFACDVSRTANFQLSFSGGHHEGLLGFGASWHDAIAHISGSDTVSVRGKNMSSREAFGEFSNYWAGHVAYLVRRLQETPEGDGSMLDNTLVYWGVESGTDHSHNPNDMQYLLIGGRNMGFQVGQFLDVGRTSAHRLHVAVMNAFGADVEQFGSADDGRGALAGVVA